MAQRRSVVAGNEGPGQPSPPGRNCKFNNPPRIRYKSGKLCKQPEGDRFGVFLSIIQINNEGKSLAGDNGELQKEDVKRSIVFAFENELAKRFAELKRMVEELPDNAPSDRDQRIESQIRELLNTSEKGFFHKMDRGKYIPKAMKKIGELKERKGADVVDENVLQTYNKYVSLQENPDEQEAFVSEIVEHIGFRRDRSSGISQGIVDERTPARPANGIDAASSARQQDNRPVNGKKFFKDSNLKPGERHHCFVKSGDNQESKGVVTLVRKEDLKGNKTISAVLEVDGAKYDFRLHGVQDDFLKKYERVPCRDWRQTLTFPPNSSLDSSSATHPSPPRAPPRSPQTPANYSSSRFSLSHLNDDPLLKLWEVDGDGHCLIHALLLCQDRNYQRLSKEQRLRRATELRQQAAEYIDSREFEQVIDNADDSTLSQLRILPHQVSEAKRLLLKMPGDGSTAAAWLDETAIAVLALMKGWNVVVLRHAAHSSANYTSEAIPTMDFFPGSIQAYGTTTRLSVHEANYDSNQMAEWLRERLQERCFVLLNLGNTHFNPLLQPDECNQAQPDGSTRDEPLQQPSTQPPIQPGSTTTSIKKKRMSDSANPDERAAKAPRNLMWSRRKAFQNNPACFMKMANLKRKNGSKGVDLAGEFWLYEELCQHKSLSREVAQDLAVLLEHSLPKDKEGIEKILRILQAGLQSIDEDQPADDNRREVIKLTKNLVKGLIDNAAVGRLSVRERVAILHPSCVGPCLDHADINKDLVYESLENDINGDGNDQMIIDLLCLVDGSVEECEHLGKLAALAHRRLPVTRAAVLLYGDPRPTAEWLVTEIRAIFTARVSKAGFEDIVPLLRLSDLQGIALETVLDRLKALLQSGSTILRNVLAEKVLKDRAVIIPGAWATAARHLEQDRIVSLLQDHIVSLPAGTEDPRSLEVGVQLELVHQLNSFESLISVLEGDDQEQPMDAECPLAKALVQRGLELEEGEQAEEAE